MMIVTSEFTPEVIKDRYAHLSCIKYHRVSEIKSFIYKSDEKRSHKVPRKNCDI